MQVFQELGTIVENRWRAKNYREESFPAIARDALAEARLSERVDPWEIIRWVHQAATLPDQKDVEGRFGDPPITVFCGSRFYIDVYYWLDGTTTIHQHSFCGAFQVLLGSSIHSQYAFSEHQTINEHFAVGELSLRSVELLKTGAIESILAGRDYIHSLFHLDRPSATVTIRTEYTPSAAIQYDYRKPYIAADPFYRNPVMLKKVQSAALLLGMKHPQADSMIAELISSSDFQTSYFVLAETFRHLKGNQLEALFALSKSSERFNAILQRAREVHGELVDLIPPVLEEEERQHDIILRRRSITGEEHRYFLALLLNVPDRDDILRLVSQRFPERDAVDCVLDWIEELGHTKTLGSAEPNVLGIEGFDDRYVFVFECLLRGSPLCEVAKSEIHDQNLEQHLTGIHQRLKESKLFRFLIGSSDSSVVIR